MRTAPLFACFSGLLLAVAGNAGAPAQRYQQIAPSADGIGKQYEGREIAHVMGWQAASWLEREEREKEERTSLLIDELRLKRGMVIADVGAGKAPSGLRLSAGHHGGL